MNKKNKGNQYQKSQLAMLPASAGGREERRETKFVWLVVPGLL